MKYGGVLYSFAIRCRCAIVKSVAIKKKALMVDDSWGNMGNHVLLMEFSHFWCITILRVDATTEFYDTYRVSSDDTNSILWMLLLHQNPYKALISVVMILSPFLHQNPQR
jgi:hypothetical protein